MKTIVVPTDFSKPANHALTYALAIARKSGARVILMHAYHRPASNNTAFRDITPILKQDAEKALTKLLKSIQAESDNATLQLEAVARKGDLAEELKKVAADYKADLIVMGTKGASGLSEIVMGTNTASVIEDASCPVLAIPEFAAYREIKQILYATDYMATENEAIAELTKFAAIFNASVILVHVAENAASYSHQDKLIAEYTRQIKQLVSYPHISFRLEESADVLNGLNNTIHSLHIDMVAMTTRKRNIYEKFFKGSITKKMAYHTDIPLLAFHSD